MSINNSIDNLEFQKLSAEVQYWQNNGPALNANATATATTTTSSNGTVVIGSGSNLYKSLPNTNNWETNGYSSTNIDFGTSCGPQLDIDWDSIETFADMKKVMKMAFSNALVVKVPIDKIEGIEKFLVADQADFPDPRDIVRIRKSGVRFKDATPAKI